MASNSSRFVGWVSLLTLLAVFPMAWFASTAPAEERKFVVFLADLPKDEGRVTPLPNRNDVWDQYFDKHKNGVNGDPLVMSHAEWWEEVSWGDVTVSGDIYGWISMPWPSSPEGFDGDTSFQSTSRIPHVELQAGFFLSPGSGEGFSSFSGMFEVDYGGDGTTVGEGALIGLNPDVDRPDGFGGMDAYGWPVWAPGERFQDLNGDGNFDGGVAEWGIDKNGNGRIDLDKQANSYGQLFSASITYPVEGEDPPTFNFWTNDTEWYDGNRDGLWNADGDEYSFSVALVTEQGSITASLYRGDRCSTEIWVDRNGDNQLGNAATRGDTTPNLFWDFLIAIHDPEDQEIEYLDEQMNGEFDFPEPYEDYLRFWWPWNHAFVTMFSGDWSPEYQEEGKEYIRDNFPGDAEALILRTGNHRYNPADRWFNQDTESNSNKGQEVWSRLVDDAEQAEQRRRQSLFTVEPDSPYAANPWSLSEFWNERYGTEPPEWIYYIPYVRIFNPSEPVPPIMGGDPDTYYPFEPNMGGPFNTGQPFSGDEFSGTIIPDYTDTDTGWYDGPAEYDDIPSSIYHRGGDGYLGEVTSPSNTQLYGEDIGNGTPGSPAPNTVIDAAGPLAYNVHGDGGFDGGNQLNIEYLTWRTDGENSTDIEVDFDGDGIPDYALFHRDINLDGMIDLGETWGDQGTYGTPPGSPGGPPVYTNYGVDALPGTPPDGGPWSEYPFNRERLLEDVVAALDEGVDWDNFLGGPGPFGNLVSGVILCPAGTAEGMFSLPAGSLDYGVRTRDRVNPGATGIEYYVPIPFFDGLGISLNEGQGEGGSFDPGETYHTTFAAHEYCHLWEGYPDLYDYDVYRQNFTGRIINNPIGAWCIMAGNYVHPVPVLKEDSGWLAPTDITRVLQPATTTTIELRSWEFDRDRTVFVYTNPLYPSESFWFWRNSPGTFVSGNLQMPPAFDIYHPGHGMLVMHVDRDGNLEGLPIQQRLESHFIYQLVQADGLQNLEAGENMGDDGDPWPGSVGATQWNRGTDPGNSWFGTDHQGQSCGLEIEDIEVLENSSRVTFHWSPRELPTFEWVQPPGGVSVNGIYTLRYWAYDQYGGTTLQFYAFLNQPGLELDYDYQIFLGEQSKQAGEVLDAFGADVRDLADGVYTFYARLLPGIGSDGRLENGWSVPRASIDNIGDGELVVDSIELAVSKFERWTATCVDDSTTNAEEWEVVGSVSGTQAGRAITGLPYTTDPDQFGRISMTLTINAGPFPFRQEDTFTFLTTGLTPHSQAVLVDEGEVVEPEAPTAVARVASGATSGLAPLTLTFRHDQSSDPHDATLTFEWNFGDGTDPVSTLDINRAITHTYETAGRYTATLTVRNAFGLEDQDTISILVDDALPPTVRVTVSPVTGVAPLRVQFSGDLTTDPNLDVQGLDFVWDFGDGSPVATTSRAVHTYVEPGIYLATLTVTNRPYGKSASRTVEIRATGTGAADQPPVAVIAADRLFGAPPLTVSFDGESSFDPEGGLLEYEWDFGDHSPIVRGVSIVEHTFNSPGVYFVTLTVVDENDQADPATISIVVLGTGNGASSPVARIVSSATQGPAPFTVVFDGTASSDPAAGTLSYLWDFGDGSPQVQGAVVEHTYTTPRDYNVVLAVANTTGASGHTTIKISVTSPDGGQGGQTAPGAGDVLPEVPAGCGPGCGPAGVMPMVLTLIGIGGLRRFKRPLGR